MRKFVREDNKLDVCSVCGSGSAQGWLYVCTEDYTDQTWKQGNEFLAPWLARSIRSGVYEDDKIGLIMRQKLEVGEEARKQITQSTKTSQCEEQVQTQHMAAREVEDDDDDVWIENIENQPENMRHEVKPEIFSPDNDANWDTTPCSYKVCHTCRPTLQSRSYLELDAIVNSNAPISSYPHACDLGERRVDNPMFFRKPGDWIALETLEDGSFKRDSQPTPRSQEKKAPVSTSDQHAQGPVLGAETGGADDDDTNSVPPSSNVPLSLLLEVMNRRGQGSSSSSSYNGVQLSPIGNERPAWMDTIASNWGNANTEMARSVHRGTANENIRGSFNLATVQEDLKDGYQSDDEAKPPTSKGKRTTRSRMRTISLESYQRVPSIIQEKGDSSRNTRKSIVSGEVDEGTPPPVPEHKYLPRPSGNFDLSNSAQYIPTAKDLDETLDDTKETDSKKGLRRRLP